MFNDLFMTLDMLLVIIFGSFATGLISGGLIVQHIYRKAMLKELDKRLQDRGL